MMGKFADALRDRRQSRQRRLGFGAVADEQGPSLLIGSVGAVAGADFWVFDEGDAPPQDGDEDALVGIRLAAANLERVTEAREAGAAFVTIWMEYARADALLDEQMDYVIRVPQTRVEDSDARALGSLRPTLVVPNLSFPLRMPGLLELRRTTLLTGAALGAIAPADVSASDLELLRDSGVVAILIDHADAEQLAQIKERVAALPERKSRRDDDLQPLLPTLRSDGGDEEDGV